jgi:hypothetical protein
LQFGLDLLDLIKKEVGRVPSQCLNYLLSACAKSRDLNKANLVWKEYALAGYYYDEDCYRRWASNLYIIFSLSHNIFLLIMMLLYGCRMYHVLLASGEHKSADSILVNKIPSFYSGLCSDLKHCYRHRYVKKNDVPVSEFELASCSWFAPLNSMKTGLARGGAGRPT